FMLLRVAWALVRALSLLAVLMAVLPLPGARGRRNRSERGRILIGNLRNYRWLKDERWCSLSGLRSMIIGRDWSYRNQTTLNLLSSQNSISIRHCSMAPYKLADSLIQPLQILAGFLGINIHHFASKDTHTGEIVRVLVHASITLVE
ncbi:Unknown protein, partial [Striga hermonthica]